MLQTALDRLRKLLTEQVAYYVTALVGLLATGGIGSGIINDPLYHEGWIIANQEWVLTFLIVALIGVVICNTSLGFQIALGLTLALSVAFAIIYKKTEFQQGNWPFIGWLLHALVYSLLVGILARVVDGTLTKFWPPARSTTRRK
mgnify:CR=1 FL=1